LVRLAGIEPTTPWFVAKYSIQLSYSREACIVAALLHFRKCKIAAYPLLHFLATSSAGHALREEAAL
jgi:hypothetical protein